MITDYKDINKKLSKEEEKQIQGKFIYDNNYDNNFSFIDKPKNSLQIDGIRANENIATNFSTL